MSIDLNRALALLNEQYLSLKIPPVEEWDGLQDAFKPFCSVPYRDGRVYVYESLEVERLSANSIKNGTQYFCTPVLLLEPRTVTQRYFSMSNKHGVSFDVIIWNEEVENIVLDYMEKQLKLNVVRGQIKPIPFKELMLNCKTWNATYECQNEWQSCESRSVLTFTLLCPTTEDAESVARAIRTQPKKFADSFEMKLQLASRGVERKETAVCIDCALTNCKSQLVSKVHQRFPKANEALFKAEDANSLLSEAANYVMTRNSLGKDVVMISESRIFAFLRSMLVTGEQTLDSQSTAKEWKTLFWSQDPCRPNLVADELNKVCVKLDRKTKVRLVEFVDATNWRGPLDRIAASLGIIGNGPVADNIPSLLRKVVACATPASGLHVTVKNLHSPGKTSKTLSVEERVKAVVDVLSTVKWQDGKFVPKPMKLTRIDLAKLRSTQHAQYVTFVELPLGEVFTAPVSVMNTDANIPSAERNEELSARLRNLEVQSNDLTSLVRSVEKETSRKIDALNTSINQLTQRMANIEDTLSNKTTSEKNKNKEDAQMENKVNQMKRHLTQLISDFIAESTKTNKKLDTKVEQLKSDLLVKETSLRRIIKQEVEVVLSEILNVKSTNAREHEEIKSSLASVESHCECGMRLAKGQSLDIASSEKMARDIAQVRQELAIVRGGLISVTPAIKKTHALLSNAEKSFKKETAQIRQQSSDLSAKLNGEIAKVQSEASCIRNEAARQINYFELIVNSLKPKRKVLFSAQVDEALIFPGSALVFSRSGLLNEGWTIDLEKGNFTVPRDGFYSLFFQSLARRDKTQKTKDKAVLSLMRNEEPIVASRAEEGQPLTLAIVQQLNNGDRLSIVIHHGALRLNEYEKPLGPISVFSAFSID